MERKGVEWNGRAWNVGEWNVRERKENKTKEQNIVVFKRAEKVKVKGQKKGAGWGILCEQGVFKKRKKNRGRKTQERLGVFKKNKGVEKSGSREGVIEKEKKR